MKADSGYCLLIQVYSPYGYILRPDSVIFRIKGIGAGSARRKCICRQGSIPIRRGKIDYGLRSDIRTGGIVYNRKCGGSSIVCQNGTSVR